MMSLVSRLTVEQIAIATAQTKAVEYVAHTQCPGISLPLDFVIGSIGGYIGIAYVRAGYPFAALSQQEREHYARAALIEAGYPGTRKEQTAEEHQRSRL